MESVLTIPGIRARIPWNRCSLSAERLLGIPGIRAHFRAESALGIARCTHHLGIGIDCGFQYAEEIGAIDPGHATELRESCWQALLARGHAQSQSVEDAKPTRRFLATIETLVLQNRVTLLPKDMPTAEPRPDRPLIGWSDSAFLYLVPEAAYNVVAKFLRDEGGGFPSTSTRLRKDLLVEQISVPDPDHTTTTVRIGDRTRRVMQLRRTAIASLLGRDFPVPSPVVTDITGFGEER